MALLGNPQHERFAQRVAFGEAPAKAYTAVGYAEKTAYTCGSRLLKDSRVRTRVIKLRQAAAQGAVSRATLNRRGRRSVPQALQQEWQ